MHPWHNLAQIVSMKGEDQSTLELQCLGITTYCQCIQTLAALAVSSITVPYIKCFARQLVGVAHKLYTTNLAGFTTPSRNLLLQNTAVELVFSTEKNICRELTLVMLQVWLYSGNVAGGGDEDAICMVS